MFPIYYVRKIAFLLLAFVFILFSCSAATDEFLTVEMKDRNPEFEKYLDNINESTGYIPEVIDFSYLGNTKRTSLYRLKSGTSTVTRPEYFDLRETGKVTSVKNQGSCGSCWAFATYASLESYLLPDEEMDFSENNLINLHGFDKDPCEGGNFLYSTAYLARWDGPINENDDPYSSSSVSQTGQDVLKHVQEVIFIPSKTSALDNDAIKVALQEYGAVSTSMYFEGSYFYSDDTSSCTNSYYYSGANNPNHGVTIVGWNDSFDFSDFSPDLPKPPGNGAFIVKNSYDYTWGENGYFYVSYYDSQFARNDMNTVFTAEDNTNYDHIYQYDTLGMTDYVGTGESTNALEAVVYTAQRNESLDAVSFYAPTTSTSYELSIFVEPVNNFFVPDSDEMEWNYGPEGNPEYSTSGVYTDAGYHTLNLTEPVNLTEGEYFCVVLDLTTPGLVWPLPIEAQISDYSSAATANDGEGYISQGGNIWQDLNQQFENSSPCIKVFTSDFPIEYPVGNIVDEGDPDYDTEGLASSLGGSYSAGSTVTINLHILDERAFYNYYNIVVERPDGTELLTTGKIGEGNLTKVLVEIPSNATSGSYHVFERDGKLTEDFFLVTSEVPEFAIEAIPILISAVGYLYMRKRKEDE